MTTDQPRRARDTRVLAVQALYQIELSGNPPGVVIGEFLDLRLADPGMAHGPLGERDRRRFASLVRGVASVAGELDQAIGAALSGPAVHRPDGPGSDGSGPDGSGPGGPGSDGSGPDGSGPDGSGPDGSGPDGSGPDGSGSGGSGPDGSGSGGSGPDGPGSDGSGPGGPGPDGSGSGEPRAGGRAGRLDVLLRTLLRCGAYELHKSQKPAGVVIREYVGIAHAFYGGREPALVHGVLDRLAVTAASAASDPV